MPNIELTIKNLTKHLDDQNTREEDLHQWLSTATGYAENVFGSNHPRVRLMDQLTKSVYGEKINNKNPNDIIEIEDQAAVYITEFIDDMKDLRAMQKSEGVVTKYPLGLGAEVFYPLFGVLIGAAFGLGFYFGNNKFDRDKIDYYNQLQRLQSDTAELHHAIHYHEIVGRSGDSVLRSLRDSLERTNNRLQKFDSAARQY